MNRQNRGVTLIELLIVVAILSIMSTALLAVVVAPIKEQVVTDLKMSQLEGTTLLLTTLVEDGRTASHIDVSGDGSAVHLHRDDPDGWRVVYHLDETGIIRRHYRPSDETATDLLAGGADSLTSAGGTPILSMVSRFSVEPTDSDRLWRIEVEAMEVRMHEEHRHGRVMQLLLGSHPRGEQP